MNAEGKTVYEVIAEVKKHWINLLYRALTTTL